MSKLTARFNIPLTVPLFASSEDTQRLVYKTKFEDFNVVIQFNPGELAPAQINEDFRFCIGEISLRISRDLIEEIPNDLLIRSDYFSGHSEAYIKAAYVIANRIIAYFKYKLHNPVLEEIPELENCFLSPTWYDENDNKIDPGHLRFSIKVPFGLNSSEFGIISLTDEGEQGLESAIEKGIVIDLYEEILSDAQSSIFQGNLRRAVLEMAMACELAIKRTYFSKSTAAGRAYEFMEDRHKISMNITDYIDGVAEYALGEKFEDASSKSDFLNIQHLFGGRNKIVHSGELFFRYKNSKDHPIDLAVLKRWWKSVERLLDWLNRKKSAQ